MDPLVLATWALVFVTAALVLGTVSLAVFARSQAKAGREATDQARRQADVLVESLDVSRRLLEAAENERAASAPLELRVDLIESFAGRAILVITNDARDAAMRVFRVDVVEMPGARGIAGDTLADGTLGLGEGWQLPITWDPSRVGKTLLVRATGHRIGGPEMTREFAFRVAQDGSLADLADTSPRIF